MQEVVREVIREVEVEVVREVPQVPCPGTVVVDKPFAPGLNRARGADLVVMAMVSFGVEVIADGNIRVYARYVACDCRSTRQHRSPYFFDLPGAATGFHRGHLPHHGDRTVRQKCAGKPARNYGWTGDEF